MNKSLFHNSRWLHEDSYKDQWKQRSVQLMDLFIKHVHHLHPSKYQVVEYGCGPYAPIYKLFNDGDRFDVRKYDLSAWDEKTKVIDLNDAELSLPTTNISVFSGVLEYLLDVPSVLRKAIKASDYILFSYSFMPAFFLNEGKYLSAIKNRAVNNGWKNHYTNKDLVELISTFGVISATGMYYKNQSLFLIYNPKLDKL